MICIAPRVARLIWLVFAAGAAAANATPNAPLEDPIYLQLAQLRAEGKLSAYPGGLRPLTESEIQRLLVEARAPLEPRFLAPDASGGWLRPATLVSLRANMVDEHLRGYSTEVRPRDMAGFVALSCEHQEGRPCGPGAGASLEVDSSAGYGTWASAFTRVRISAGNHAYEPAIDLDRAYLNFELGPVAMEVGRDVQVLGPAARSALMLSDHAAPLDHVRVSTARPLNVIGENGSILRFDVRYFVARLRDPQRFQGTLLTGARAQFQLLEALELGGTRLLELGGAGAPPLSFGDFVLEHFIRRSGPTGVGVSNNRLSFDISYTVAWFHGVRGYYELAFEDNRRQFINTLEFQTDHLLGLELADFDGAGHHGIVLEYHRTGFDSQEHSLFTSGMTNAGRTLGSPLGPDAWSLYGRGRIDLNTVRLSPWLEWASFSSDAYSSTDNDNGPIIRLGEGVAERRFRAGLDVYFTLTGNVFLDVRAFGEHVKNSQYITASSRFNGGMSATIRWAPGTRLSL